MTDIVERLREIGNELLQSEDMPHRAVVIGAADEIERLRALLRELIDIEGPQPGTADWAAKVRAALDEQAAQ